jgi:hypothetical protein
MLKRGAEAATTEIGRIGDEDPTGISGQTSRVKWVLNRPRQARIPGFR